MECIRGHVYTLNPSPEHEDMLAQTVGVVRLVYNLALEQRRIWGGRQCRDGSRLHFHSKSSSGELSALRRAFDWIGAVSQTAQNQALVDLDQAYANFFAGKAGYPRPRKRGVDDSFRQAGREIELRQLNGKWAEVKLPKIGWIRLRLTRPLRLRADGRLDIRNAAVRRRSGGGWEISIATRCEIADRPVPDSAVGIDRGAAVPFALSTGEMIRLPGTVKRRERVIRRAQKDLSRRKRGSQRYAKAQRRLAKLKARDARARSHTAHVLSRRLVRDHGMIAIEDLQTRSMTASARGTLEAPGRNVAQKAGLNRAILNVGWHALERMLGYKLTETGGILVKVPAAYSSQTCCACGHVDRRSRESQAIFACTACGAASHADTNAARVILQRALAGADEKTAGRGNTPSLDVEGKALPPCETSTPSRMEGLDATT
ncbi:RNA-guided endonuclease InsQ/TnpB family protein [Paracoccus benzoatiresistens]|uniref:Transposase n=1 Tax=Paracoccus benzoatiresistens TaxID=2997341 RepID=A0ABT4J5S9_9RHOB|nr:transposase [Paracoccus sp. EF6]MCZ0962431.1 transposase [Paracoccus sp. EF6]